MPVLGYGLEPFGFGPYGGLGGVILPATTPPLGGYGGYAYGLDPYGALGGFGGPVVAVTGGYGGYAYGLNSYGSIGGLDGVPAVLSAVSVTGFVVEVFFSQEMSADADLFDPTSYVLGPLVAGASTTVLSVEAGVVGVWGPTSVLLHHTGTTLGGLYHLTVSGPRDIGGTAIEAYAPLNQTDVLCKGEPPSFTITPLSGNELLYEFEFDLLDEGSFSPGVLQLSAYGFETSYPQNLVPVAVEHPYTGDARLVRMDVLGMTSTNYVGFVSPATALEYPATYLPNAAEADFTAQELGTGSVVLGSSGLLFSKSVGFAYGWRFLDDSGRLVPGSSYRADVSFDVSDATIAPAPASAPLVLVLVSDGAVEVSLAFRRLAGIDTIEVQSGTFSASVAMGWSAGATTVSVVRNQRADSYTIVVNDEPLVADLTSAFVGPAGFPAGVQFFLDPSAVYDIQSLTLSHIRFTASQTVFSSAWNFLHNQQAAFVGSAALTRDSLLTAKGPLVKGWGDATPATTQDVAVYVNDVAVEIADVNPYYGLVTLVVPIPLMPPGSMSVTVDYIWFPTPVMELAGLNTLGLVLNKYDCQSACSQGGWSAGSGLPGGGTNGVEFSRFPMGVVLGPRAFRSPLLRSPRFVAFQKPYTASLNSPTTLLLNRNPHQVALSDEEQSLQGQIVFYEGSVDPTEDASNPWSLIGVNNLDTIDFTGVGDVPVGLQEDAGAEGFFQIWKVTTGSFGTGQPGFYERTAEVPSPSSLVMVVRFQVRTDGVNDDGVALPIMDGVFTGVGFGCHTNTHLYLVGALLINGVQHVGMLVEPAFVEQASAWQLAYGTSVRIVTANTFVAQSADLPQMLRERLVSNDVVRFQILSGTQSGVYSLVEIVDQADGTSTCTVASTTSFPADPTLFGNRDFTVYFEARWDGDGQLGRPSTYRLVVKNDIKGTPQGMADLYVGGAFTGKALTLDGAPPFAIPPDGVLEFPTGESGEVFFGSLDRQASNLSDWYFVRYAVDPGVTTQNFRQIVVSAEMNELPEDDPNNIWFLTQEFGSRVIDATADRLLLKATCADNQLGVEGQDLTIGYARVEPFLTRKLAIDVDSAFQLDNGVLGAGDMQWVVRDGVREVRLATILYQESLTSRSLLSLPNLSLSGLLLPDAQGWLAVGALQSARVQGHRMEFVQEFGQTLTYTLDLLQAGATAPPNDGRILEARVQVTSVATTDVTGDTGIFFGTDVGPLGSARGIGLQLRVAIGTSPSQVSLYSLSTGLEVVAYDVEWDDGRLHSYRVLADVDTDAVTLVVDDVLRGTTPFTSFTLSSTDTQASLGFVGGSTRAVVVVEDLSVVGLPPVTAHRTLGVFLGGDADDINSWQLPRTDVLEVPNSDLSAIIQEMDWRSRTRVRIHRDPSWGVTILRPDLPPPPYFTGNFATQFTEPSAGWINVEYNYLPPVPTGDRFGYVAFGALDPRSIMQARIDDVRYRVYRYATENVIMPPHMVLNQYNVVTSGEIQKDVTVESYTVTSIDSQTISLSPTNIVADRVFNFSFVNSAGRTVTYLPGSFVFDQKTQIITITSQQTLGFYPSQDVPDAVDPNVNNPSLNDPTDFVFPTAVLLNPLDPNFVADTHGYPLNTKVAVTVSFAPGAPYTRTYVCSQPLLDGVTLLNEGTPPFDTSQVSRDVRFLAWGSRINDPNDTLNNDPDFILNDPFRFIDFSVDAKVQYEELEFCEVSEGQTCLIAPFCDENTPGALEAGHPGNTPGDIGNGLIEMDLGGLIFTEIQPIGFTDNPSDAFGNSVSSVFLHASGNGSPPGGNLNQAILFTPLGPETPHFQTPDGSVGWSVFGQLYDTLTNTTTVLFFGTESLGP
jgi:hypothetical protein